MTTLLDLPNDMLLKIVEYLNISGDFGNRTAAVDRRRLSKTCHRLFHLIRVQKNWKKYHWMEEAYDMNVHAMADDVFFLVWHVKCEVYDERFYVICSPTAVLEPHLEEFGKKTFHDAIPTNCLRTRNPREATVAMLHEISQYFTFTTQRYHTSIELFDVRIAGAVQQVTKRRSIWIVSDAVNAQLEEVYHQLFLVSHELIKKCITKGKDEEHGDPAFCVFHKHKVYIWKLERSACRRRQQDVFAWRKNMVERLKGVCADMGIPCKFTKDPRKLMDMDREFCLRYRKNGTVEGVFPSRLGIKRVRNYRTSNSEPEYDSESDPEEISDYVRY